MNNLFDTFLPLKSQSHVSVNAWPGHIPRALVVEITILYKATKMDDFCAQQKWGKSFFCHKKISEETHINKKLIPFVWQIFVCKTWYYRNTRHKKCCGVHGDMFSLFGFVNDCLVNIGFKIGLIAGWKNVRQRASKKTANMLQISQTTVSTYCNKEQNFRRCNLETWSAAQSYIKKRQIFDNFRTKKKFKQNKWFWRGSHARCQPYLWQSTLTRCNFMAVHAAKQLIIWILGFFLHK